MMHTPSFTSPEYVPENRSVWLVGDHYYGWMAFERKPGLDNDPEHQPSHVALHRQPRFYYAPGGAWYVKKFLDRVWTNNPALRREVVTLACPPEPNAMGPFFAKAEAFAPGIPTVSFTLDAYPRQPDGPVEDKVFRIKSHHGYSSAGDSIERERATIKRRRRELEQSDPAQTSPRDQKALSLRQSNIDSWVAKHDQSGLDYFNAFLPLTENSGHPELLIIDDMDMGFRDYKGFSAKPEQHATWGTLLHQHFRNDPDANHIIVLLGRSLPDLSRVHAAKPETSEDPAGKSTGMWSQLSDLHADQTIVIVNADLLRFTGAPISRRTSWERTAEDCIAALEDSKNDKKLAPFASFAHLIIRFGVAGAIHYYREGASPNKTADLYYDSKAHDGIFRDVEEEGGIVGNNSVFAACLSRYLLESRGRRNDNEAIRRGIVAAIPTCQRFFRKGYGDRSSEAALSWLDNWSDPPDDLFVEPAYEANMLKGHSATHSSLVVKIKVPRKDQQVPWRIAAEATETDEKRLLLAHDIVKRGLAVVLNNPLYKEDRRVFTPIGTFGNLNTIDRDEIERFRAISNILRQYLKVISSDPLAGPMSLGVFGPSGSGKSYTVREIVRGVDPRIEESFFEVNMAQLSSPKELASYLLRVHDAISAEKTPLVFFDEFDCTLNGAKLGWLKYFLAPMEGGTFKHPEEGVFRLGRGIFVFAGGTQPRYDLFLRNGRGLREEFEAAKGPDFLSRLRGHINVKGINSDGEDHGGLYCLRRAIILRSLLDRGGLITEVDNIAQIDGSLLNALLVLKSKEKGTDEAFTYDARSLKTVLDMCLRLHGRIEKASLPPPDLLSMHVDSKQLEDEMKNNPDHEDLSADMSTLN